MRLQIIEKFIQWIKRNWTLKNHYKNDNNSSKLRVCLRLCLRISKVHLTSSKLVWKKIKIKTHLVKKIKSILNFLT